MKEIMNVSIIGMGALGILYGEFMTRKMGMESVSFVADSDRIAKYRGRNITCNGESCSFTLRQASTVSVPADLLIFAVKGTALQSALHTAEKLVGKDTVILSVLNGITSEETIGSVFGMDHIVYCVAQGMDAVRTESNLTYTHMGKLCIGLPKSLEENKGKLNAVVALFDKIQLPYTLEPDIMHRLWGKWMLNVGVNQVVMVSEGTYGTIQKEGPERERMKAAMREVLLLSQKEQISLSEQDFESYVALIDTMNPDGMPSMRQDGLAGRRTEVEMFAGTVVRKAAKYGLPVPVNAKLYEDIKSME